LNAGDEPESLDKEIVRRALIDAGYDGHGPPPTLDAAVWDATSRRYIDAYERLTGLTFQPASYPVEDRIKEVLAHVA
jgi:phosphoribosylaminoimidazole-succinocarboxamide synthase